MEDAGHEVPDPPSPVSTLPPVLAPVLMIVFWVLLGGAAGIKIMQSIWRFLGVEVGEVTIAVPIGGAVGALAGALLGLINNPRLLVLLMAVFAGASAGGVAGEIPWGAGGEIVGQVAGGLVGGIAWAIWLLMARIPVTVQRMETKGKARNQMMSNTNSVVAVFESHEQAENAIRALQKDGFDMKKLSIVGKDYHTEEHVVGYYTTGDRMLYWGKLGAFWGGFWGLLLGSAFFWVPGIGQLLVAGPLVMWIVGALEEAAVVGGLSALGAALFSIGIPKNSVVQYETEVKNGKLLLVAHGTADEVERARKLLHQSRAKMATVHAEPESVGV